MTACFYEPWACYCFVLCFFIRSYLYPFTSWGFHAECFLCSPMLCILTYWFILLFSQILCFHYKSNSNVFSPFLVRIGWGFFLAKNSFCDCWIVFWGKGISSIASACNAQLVFSWVYIIIFFIFRFCLFFSFCRTDHSKNQTISITGQK